MEHHSDLAASLLERSIAQHRQRLANAQACNNTRLAARVQKDLERLLDQQQEMSGVAVERPAVRVERRALDARPQLRDERTVVDPHGERWTELVGYVQSLDEHFPNEHLADHCGLFSTEGEFARYIREVERRIADER